MQLRDAYAIVDEVDNILIDEAQDAADHQRPRTESLRRSTLRFAKLAPQASRGRGLHR